MSNFLCLRTHDLEAAEQALPHSRARAGGRVDIAAATLAVLRAGGFVVVGAGLPRTSYPCRCAGTGHQRLHA